eukprot:7190625-Pyramimonas_sp.AAC.1
MAQGAPSRVARPRATCRFFDRREVREEGRAGERFGGRPFWTTQRQDLPIPLGAREGVRGLAGEHAGSARQGADRLDRIQGHHAGWHDEHAQVRASEARTGQDGRFLVHGEGGG